MALDAHTPLFKLKSVLPDLLDSQTGILSVLSEHPREAGSAEFFRFMSQAADTRAFGDFQNFAVGGGAASDRDTAIAKTVGEAIERYSAAVYDKSDMRYSSFRDADFLCIHPGKFQPFADSQFNESAFQFKKVDDDSPVRWVETCSLVDNHRYYVPAGVVYIPYIYYRKQIETPITQPISTGLACHMSVAKATIGGICEVIERDCFSITWQAMVSRERIDLASLDPVNKDLVQRFLDVGCQIWLHNISNETGIPTILAVIRSDTPGAVPIATAASTDLNPQIAIQKALEELAHTERYFSQIKNELPRIEVVDGFNNITSQIGHVNFWINPGICHHADFLTASDKTIQLSEIPNLSAGNPEKDLRILVKKLADTGQQVLVTDLTTEDVRSLGFFVIRVLIPDYHPLHMGYVNRALGCERLWTVPQKLGFSGIERATGDNPYPHPFP